MTADRTKPWNENLQDASERIEQDLKRLVAYLNDEVVPDVRRNGSPALRTAAAKLQRLAAQMDDQAGQAPPPPGEAGR